VLATAVASLKGLARDQSAVDWDFLEVFLDRRRPVTRQVGLASAKSRKEARRTMVRVSAQMK
jgi:hypothetical protein